MSSKVSSMLVQQGLLAISELQEALALQVVRGGTLDTIILERGLLPESTMIELLSRSTEHPPIQPDTLDRTDRTMAEHIPEEAALALGICPIYREADQLHVLSSDATETTALSELAHSTKCTILPAVATELRLMQAYQLVYGTPLSARFRELIEKHGERPASVYWSGIHAAVAVSAPTEPAGSSIPDPGRPPKSVAPRSVSDTRLEDDVTGSPRLVDTASSDGDTITSAPGTDGGRRRATTDRFPVVLRDLPMEEPAPPDARDTIPDELQPISPTIETHASTEGASEPDSIDRSSGAPLAAEDAEYMMERTTDREALLRVLLRASHQYLATVQLYLVRGQQLVGTLAIHDGQLDTTQIRQHRIALDLPTVVARSVRSGSIYVGPPPDTDASRGVLMAVDAAADHLALIPVVMRGKTVCMLIGHRGGHPISTRIRKPLSELAEHAAQALARFIVERKRRSTDLMPVAPADEATQPNDSRDRFAMSGEIGINQSPPDGIGGLSEPGQHDLVESESKVIVAFDTSVADHTIEDLVHALDDRPDTTDDVLPELRRRGTSAVQWLLAHFPGRLRFDADDIAELPPASECSAVLQALTFIGRTVVPTLAPLLVQADDQSRFFATYLLSELTYPEVVSLLAERLHDPSSSVRRAAIYGLRCCRELDQFPRILEELRADLVHPDSRPQQAAMEALAALGDVVATPSLIAVLRDDRPEIQQTAHRSLVLLTRQDFGRVPGEWVQWWNANRQRHRIEWLIDALIHPRADIREAAAIDLRDLTGLTFDYRADLPEDERNAIKRRYLSWWTETGLHDFGRFA